MCYCCCCGTITWTTCIVPTCGPCVCQLKGLHCNHHPIVHLRTRPNMGQKPSSTANIISVTSGSSGNSSLSRTSTNANGAANTTTSSRSMMLNWATLLGNGLVGKASTVVSAQQNRPEQPIKFQYRNKKSLQKTQESDANTAADSGGTKIINTTAITALAANNHINNSNNSNLSLKITSLNKKDRHNRHRRKVRQKEKIEPQQQRVLPQFGYEIQDIDDFLTRATLDKPANIPVVLAFPSVLYQTRVGGYQAEIALPLGMVVNAVFKNQHWLYVQTPHAEEGYVSYTACLPLGIIPSTVDSTSNTSSGSPRHCWEHCSDVFPKPSGNQTDTEKISSYSNNSTSSKTSSILIDDDCDEDVEVDDAGDVVTFPPPDSQSLVQVETRRRTRGGNKQQRHNRRQAVSVCGERSVDRLYLRATANNKRLLQLRQQFNSSYSDNILHNDHHNNTIGHLQAGTTNAEDMIADNNGSTTLDTLLVVRCDYQPSIEQHSGNTDAKMAATAMANVLKVNRGDVVSLLAVARQPSGWFWVRTRGGVEGFIPAAIVGHGFL